MIAETWSQRIRSTLRVNAEPLDEPDEIGIWLNREAGRRSLFPPETRVFVHELESTRDWLSLVHERLGL